MSLPSYVLTRLDVQYGEHSQAIATRYNQLETLVHDKNEALKAFIAHELAKSAAIMSDNTPRLPKLHPNVKRARARREAAAAAAKQARSSQGQGTETKEEIEAVRVSVQSRGNWCSKSCPCQCHDTRRSASPTVLNRVLGQLFLGYSGIPLVTPACNYDVCKQSMPTKVQAEYWFPAHLFWSNIFQVEATFQMATGPSLQLRSYRHVPDSAPAVNYAVNGNIDALKTLFAQGLASPIDVSDTRGYSLLRVSGC